ncbi:hypothetical protein MHB77_32575 [Paenibacillus sp. FSL K6-3166]|uniref:hypothetical protein n=1 Tax=unclassified Paenibacillus TaxID=185978 RepID=UPI000BA0539D|nr:hypothetical protein [Paenibacillus sp. VTT E-133291]OZQ84667.1 hypothetical protein CA598_23010 [Paenibacillus sp. VTT E-133291]
MSEEQRLSDRKETLETELAEISARLAHIERMKKPYEAVVHHWCCNRSSTFWKTEEQARKKMDEYFRKTYYLNGRVDRVQLVKYEENGSTTVIEDKKK